MSHTDGNHRVSRARLLVGLLILAVSVCIALVCASSGVALEPQSERIWIPVALVVALVMGLWAIVAPRRRPGGEKGERALLRVLPLAGLVLLWSLFVRFGLTTPNVLTDGGSGFHRLLYGSPGFGGISYLMDLVLSDEARWDIWSAIRVTTALSALAPALVVLFARELGFGKRAAVLAGLCLACLPLHAAMFSSDLIVGSAISLMLAGLTLVAVGIRMNRASAICAGTALLSFVCWMRPEGVLVAGILLPVLWLRRRQLFHSTLGLAGIGWLLINSVVGYAAHSGAGTLEGGRIGIPALSDFFSRHIGSSLSMSWFVLAVVVGLLLMVATRRAGTIVVVVGFALGLAPPYMAIRADSTGNYVEAFRYGTWSLPFMVIAAGVAFATLARGLSLIKPLGGSADKRQMRATVIVAVALAAIPLIHLEYLQRHYNQASEIPIILEALELVPEECVLVVPEDDPRIMGTHEILRLYGEISRGEVPLHGVVSFVERLDEHGRLPETNPSGWGSRGNQTVECWYFLEAAYCSKGLDGLPLDACAELLERTPHQLIQEWEFEFINHLQVVRLEPRAREYDSALRVALYQLGRPVGEDRTPPPSEQ